MTQGHLSSSTRVGYGFLCVGLVLFSGCCSGLTLGLLSLDRVDLEVLVRSGSEAQKRYATAVAPIVAQGHRLLVTLLLLNAAAMETLPIFLDALTTPLAAILISVTMVLCFGEIIPQALCQRYGLAIGYHLRYLVWVMLFFALPLSYPLGRLLDWLLGEEAGLFRRAQLKALVDIHRRGGGHGGELSTDETTIISGALDMTAKDVRCAMTPIARVRAVSLDTPLTWPSLHELVACGHSRIPVHAPGDPHSIVGLLLVKELFARLRLEDLQPAAAAAGGGKGPRARTLADAVPLRPIPRMSADTPLYTALNYFQTGRSHMAIVHTGDTLLYLDGPKAALARSRSGDRLGTGALGGAGPAPAAGPPSRGRPGVAGGAALLPGHGASPGAGGAGGGGGGGAAAHPPPPAPRVPPNVRTAPAPQPQLGAHAAWPAPPPGLVLGILTLEDVLEELLQEEILDETDRADGEEPVAAAAVEMQLTEHLVGAAWDAAQPQGPEGGGNGGGGGAQSRGRDDRASPPKRTGSWILGGDGREKRDDAEEAQERGTP